MTKRASAARKPNRPGRPKARPRTTKKGDSGRSKKTSARAERNIAWIEQYCRVPEGTLVGQPLKLRPWQKEIIHGIYGSPTRRAIISFGRKNGKTALVACLLLLHLVGPEARPNSELYSTALSRDQAAITFKLALKMVLLSPELAEYVVPGESYKRLTCPELGTLYMALSADASTAMGKSPVFTVHDELGQVRGPRHELYDAMETASGAHEEPLTVVISTQAPTDNDLLSILIDDAKAGGDPTTKLYLWSADEDADPFSEKTIRQANPAFGDFLNTEVVLEMAESARRMPAREAQFRNLILNQRVESHAPFVVRSVWQANGGDVGHPTAIWGGLDLSETNDLTALVLVWQIKKKLHVRPYFWLPEADLAERSRKDRVPYDMWHKQGFLNVTPGKSVEYRHVAKVIANLFETHEIRRIAFDRYNMKHLRPWLLEVGLSDAVIEDRFVDFGQGYISMSPALRTLESMLLNERLCHGMHPVLTMCAANAVVKMDEAGNRKLDKKRSRGRIDGLVCLAMATSIAEQELHEKRVFKSDVQDITE